MLKKTLALVGLSVLILSTNAHAATVEYTFQGGTFEHVTDSPTPVGETFTLTDSITGSFVVSGLGANILWQDITVDSFSFSAGAMSITSSDSTLRLADFSVSTDANGIIVDWGVRIESLDDDWGNNIIGGQYRRISFGTSASNVQQVARWELCTGFRRNGDCAGAGVGGTEIAYDMGSITSSNDSVTLTAREISPVPIPAAGWLFMSALVGLAGKKRLIR